MLRVDVITIFPDVFEPYLSEGMLAIAREKGLLEVHIHNLRDYTTDKHKSVDDRPYGGGPGMVMMPGPIFDAVEHIAGSEFRVQSSESSGAANKTELGTRNSKLILLTPQGQTFNQRLAAELALERRLIFVCGRYEGFDERVHMGLGADEISIGDYVLTGGELPAAVIIDAVTRLIPGVLGHEDSARLDSFSDCGLQNTSPRRHGEHEESESSSAPCSPCLCGENSSEIRNPKSAMLACPQYTRPPEFRGMKVPDVLLSGNHKAIADWRRQHSLERTRRRRPDMLAHSPLINTDKHG